MKGLTNTNARKGGKFPFSVPEELVVGVEAPLGFDLNNITLTLLCGEYTGDEEINPAPV